MRKMEFGGDISSSSNGRSGSSSNNNKGRMGRRRVYDDTKQYKSKNLEAERRRRAKLSDRLLALRASVPIITNMNKEMILEDAITYITELQKQVEELTDILQEMEVSSSEEELAALLRADEIDSVEEMSQFGIQEDVQVTNVDGIKIWVRIILQKKRGRLTKLMESMAYIGLEFTDTGVTTSKGAMLVSSCVESTYGDTLTVQRIKDLLLEIIRGI